MKETPESRNHIYTSDDFLHLSGQHLQDELVAIRSRLESERELLRQCRQIAKEINNFSSLREVVKKAAHEEKSNQEQLVEFVRRVARDMDAINKTLSDDTLRAREVVQKARDMHEESQIQMEQISRRLTQLGTSMQAQRTLLDNLIDLVVAVCSTIKVWVVWTFQYFTSSPATNAIQSPQYQYLKKSN